MEEIPLTDVHAEQYVALTGRNVLSRRSVLAARPPTRPAAGGRAGQTAGPPAATKTTTDDDNRRQAPASKTILAH